MLATLVKDMQVQVKAQDDHGKRWSKIPANKLEDERKSFLERQITILNDVRILLIIHANYNAGVFTDDALGKIFRPFFKSQRSEIVKHYKDTINKPGDRLLNRLNTETQGPKGWTPMYAHKLYEYMEKENIVPSGDPLTGKQMMTTQ